MELDVTLRRLNGVKSYPPANIHGASMCLNYPNCCIIVSRRRGKHINISGYLVRDLKDFSSEGRSVFI